MIDRDAIIEEALTWCGTPFFHTGREKGKSCDCAGLIIGVFNNVGLLKGYDFRQYSQYEPEGMMRKLLSKFCIDFNDPMAIQKGDIMLFTINGFEQHIAIATQDGGGRMCHAFQTANVVSEHETTDWWKRHRTGLFEFVGEK